MRLDKLLAHMNYGSRKEVKGFIRKGYVLVNGEVVRDDDFKVDEELDEIVILEEYLPEQLSVEEVEEKVKEIIAEVGASSMKDMGMVMKTAKEKLGASADGKTINDIAKKLLN